MKRSLHTVIAKTSLAAIMLMATPAIAQHSLSHFDGDMSAAMRRMAPNANLLNAAAHNSPLKVAENQFTPSITVGPVSAFQDIDGPNDETWYYSTQLVSESIEHEFYTEYILHEYFFNIYNASMQYVGTVHDKMRYADDEVRVPGPAAGIDLLPVITKNFFNTDDNYEIVVSIAVNTDVAGNNRYYSRVYSLNGPTEELPVWDSTTGQEVEKTVDVPVAEYFGFIGDVLDASIDGEENYYMTFMHEIHDNLPEDFDFSEASETYWELHSTAKWDMVMYGPATIDGQLTHIHTFEVPFMKQQGNMENTSPFISFLRDGQVYVLIPHYKELFYEPFYSYYEDMVQAENNTFVIDLYTIGDNEATLKYSTEIPMSIDTDMEALYTYYAVGSLRYYNDVDFTNFTTDGTPAYYVQRSNYQISSDGETDYSYYVYNVKGQKLKTIFEYASGTHGLSNVEGFNPQHAFITYEDSYLYNMVDLIEGYDPQTTVVINSALQTDPDNDPETMLANFDRVADGISYKYAFEMKDPAVDENSNDIMRIAWINRDGSFDHMDEINMGTFVYYAQCYINATMLNPEMLHEGPEHEYMILIKRGLEESSTASQEELIVAQPISETNPEGTTLLYLTPCEKGVLRSVGLTTIDREKSLMIIWLNDDGCRADIYNLPLTVTTGSNAEITIPEASEGAMTYADGQLLAPGLAITVYNANGMTVGEGQDALAIDTLPAGLYVAKAGDTAIKFVVK